LAAAKAARQRPASVPASTGKTESTPSPMNFNTSPAWACTASVTTSK
jgi:hypothetical protein